MSQKDLSRLVNPHRIKGDAIEAQCPACAQDGEDLHGRNHLIVYPDGAFACVVHPDDPAHNARIRALLGWNGVSISRPPPGIVRIQRWEKLPSLDLERQKKAIDPRFGLADLEASSPVKDPAPDDVLRHLFPEEGALICMGWDFYFPWITTLPVEAPPLGVLTRIVPSPMPAHFARNGERTSVRCERNTGPRHWLIVEFDPREDGNPAIDDQASLLWHLSEYAALGLVVFSGNKSLHGWFDFREQPELTARHFFRYATTLGADPQFWHRHQMTRMPGGLHENGIRQAIHFFDP